MPEFYYSYEEEFNLEGFSVRLEVDTFEANEDNTGYVTKTVTVDIPYKYLKVDGDVKPSNTYNGKTFIYNVPVKLNITDDATDISNDPAIIKALQSDAVSSLVIPVPAYIGQKGDYNLDHNVAPLDVTHLLIDLMETGFGNDSTIISKVPDAAKEEVPEDRILEFANFLADVDENGDTVQYDATKTLIAIMEFGFTNEDRITKEIWDSVLNVSMAK